MTNNIFDQIFDLNRDIINDKNYYLIIALEKIPVWIYWDSGWENAPKLSQLCLKSWQIYHGSDSKFIIQPINLHDVRNLVNLAHYDNKNIDPTAYSDIIRLELVNKYGGVWADSTVFCTRPLDDWLTSILSNHMFWSYNGHEIWNKNLLNASYFFASNPDSYIMQKWTEACREYWTNRTNKDNYFWVFYLFTKIYREDSMVQKLWDNTPHMDAYEGLDGPHYFVPYQDKIFNSLTQEYQNYIDNNNVHIFKLTRHHSRGYAEHKIYDTNYTINYLLKKHKII